MGWHHIDWATASIDGMLTHGWVNRFYIGITWQPAHRWGVDLASSHRYKGYTKMYLLACDTDPVAIIDAEKAVISRFRPFDRNGLRLAGGHFLCQNKNPGGEGGGGEGPIPLFFVCLFCLAPWAPHPPSTQCCSCANGHHGGAARSHDRMMHSKGSHRQYYTS